MRFFSTLFFSIAFVGLLIGQADQSRSGRYLLDGSSRVGNQSVGIGGGYFITDRVVGSFFYQGANQVLAPSVRYYIMGGEQWRPYLDLGVEINTRQPGDFFRSINLTAGVERQIVESVLLNFYAFGSRNWLFEDIRYGIQGELNALLGGSAGRIAAEQKLKSSAVNVANRLGHIGFTTSDMADRFSVTLNPEMGILLSKHDQLNIRPLLSFSSAEQETITPSQRMQVSTNFITLGIEVGYRRYLFTNALFNPYAEGFAAYRVSFGTINRDGNRIRSTSYRGDFGLKVGTTSFIAPAVSVDTALEVNRWVVDDRNGVSVSLNGGLRFWLK